MGSWSSNVLLNNAPQFAACFFGLLFLVVLFGIDFLRVLWYNKGIVIHFVANNCL